MKAFRFRQFLSDTFLYSLSQQVPLVINFFLLPFLTPHLVPQDYGIHGIILAYYGMFEYLKDLGFISILPRIYFSFPRRFKFVWDRLYGFLSLWCFTLSIITGICLSFLIPEEAESNKELIILLLCIPIAFFEPTTIFGTRFFQITRRPKVFVFTSILGSSLSLIVTYICIAELKLGYLGWYFSLFIAKFSYFIAYSFLRRKYKYLNISFSFNKKWIWSHLKFSLPTIPHNYSVYLMDVSDRVLLDYYQIPIQKIGLYNLGSTFGKYFNILNNAFGQAGGIMLMEAFSKNSIPQEKEARKNTWLFQTLILILGFTTALWIEEIFSLIIRNKELQGASSVTAVILLSYAARILYYPVVNKLIFLKENRKLWIISFIAGVIKIILDIILIGKYGIWACVFSQVIAGLYLTFSGFNLSIFRKNNRVNYYPRLWMILFLSLFGILWFTLYEAFEIKIIINAIIISFLIIFTKYLMSEKNR